MATSRDTGKQEDIASLRNTDRGNEHPAIQKGIQLFRYVRNTQTIILHGIVGRGKILGSKCI